MNYFIYFITNNSIPKHSFVCVFVAMSGNKFTHTMQLHCIIFIHIILMMCMLHLWCRSSLQVSRTNYSWHLSILFAFTLYSIMIMILQNHSRSSISNQVPLTRPGASMGMHGLIAESFLSLTLILRQFSAWLHNSPIAAWLLYSSNLRRKAARPKRKALPWI